MKKLFNLLSLSLLCSTALVGCGGTSEITPSFDINDNGDLVFDDDGNIKYENVVLNMWSVTTGDDANTQDKIIKGFNDAYKGMIEVKTRHTSRYELETILTSTLEFDKKNAPDLLFNHSARTAEYHAKNWLQPIENMFAKTEINLDKNDYVTNLLNACTIDDKIYGIPQDVHSSIIDIRKDILIKNNLEIPTDFNSLIDTCEDLITLASEGNLFIRGYNTLGVENETWRKASIKEAYTPFPIAYGDMWVHEFFGYTSALQNGGRFIDKFGMPAWNSNEVASGLQLLKDWIFPNETSHNKYALSKSYGSDYDVGNEPFRNGNAVFKLSGPWEYQNDLSIFANDLKDDQGSDNITTRSLANMLSATNNESGSLIKGEGHAIMLMDNVESLTKGCAAAVFADYMANYSGIEWAKRGHLPAVKSVANSSEYKEDPSYTSYIKNWGEPSDYYVMGASENYSTCDLYFKKALQKVMSNQYVDSDIKSVLQEQYDDCVAYIELYK